MAYDQIIKDIQNKIYSPVYFLQGEEPFFNDQLTSYIEKNVLDESVREFNQMVVYGRDITPKDVIDLARRYPMMGNYQVVIVKEAQYLKNIEELESYIAKPLDTTILVISYKYKKFDKRKSFYKKLNKSKDVVVFDSEKLSDYKIPRWIEKSVSLMGYSIHPYASELLAEHLGNDLGKINNELDKLAINLEKGSKITEDEIESHIGISKDFNVFEFQKSLWQMNALKAHRIVNYYESNPKDHPLQMLSVMLHNYFIKVFLYHQIRNLDERQIAAELGINPYFVKDYKQAAMVFSPQKIQSIISLIKSLDLKSKGIGTQDSKSYGDLREFVVKVMN